MNAWSRRVLAGRRLLNRGCALFFAAALLPSLPAQGAISFVGTGATYASNSSGSCRPVVPTVNVGDLLVAHVAVRGNQTVTIPTGWSRILNNATNNDTRQTVYYKFADTGDSGATVTFSLNNNNDNVCVVTAYRGVDPALAFDAYLGATGNSATPTAPSVTTAIANDWLLTFYGSANAGARPFTLAAGQTETYDFANTNGTGGLAVAGGYELRPAAGTTGTHAATASASARWVAQSAAIRPDVTAPTVSAIVVADANPTNAATVSWTVTFSEGVVNVQASNFALVNSGLSGPAITGVTGSGNTWTVTATTGTGSGTLGLNLTTAGTIQDYATNALGSALPFVGGVYTVDRTSPTVLSIARAGASPTSAANVSWTVTFSKAVTGVAISSFTLVNGGLSGSPAIFSVSGSGTTWTVTASTGDGSATGTLGLNMTSSAGVTDLAGNALTGLPFTGEVYTIGGFTQDCLTDNFSTGTLDTTLWNVQRVAGTYTPAVANAGGGDYRLRLTTALNNESTFAQLKRTFPGSGNKIVLEIDYFAFGGSNPGADGTAIVLSDSTVTSTTGGYGGSLGYAQNVAAGNAQGFGGGWLGIGLDEYGNYPCNNEGRTGYPAGWIDPVLGAVTPCGGGGGNTYYVAVRGSGSGLNGYNLLANTGLLTSVAPASGAGGATPYRYRFTVDHSDGVHAWVKVERDVTATGNNYTTLIPSFDVKAAGSGQATVPNRWFISFTSSTGGATNYHDFKRVRICANTISTSTTGPDHFVIQHATGTGVTCTSSTVTIVACANASCSSLYTGGTSGTLTATGLPTVNGLGAFTIPSGSSSVTKAIQVTTAGNVTLGVSSSDAANAAQCNFGSPSCTFTADGSGFIVTAPNHVAETNSALTVQAVRSSDSALVCVPAFANTSKTVNLKCSYNNPAPASGTLPVRIGGYALNSGMDATAACDTTGANLALAFDANGIATPLLQYADVGQVTVTATHTGSSGALDAGLTMNGGSSFITRPHHFDLAPITQMASPYRTNPAAGDYTGNPFAAAGQNFSVLAIAKNAINNVTPNYGRENSAESVQLLQTLINPGTGDAGTLSPVTYTGAFGTTGSTGFAPFGTDCTGAAAAGSACGVFTWSEVGVITLAGRIGDNDYLGTGEVADTSSHSGNVGRFYPANFLVSPAQAPACGTVFTYGGHSGSTNKMGQPFNTTATITARNVAGGTTTNYTATTTGSSTHGYMKLTTSQVTVAPNPTGQGALGISGDTLTAGATDGTMAYAATGVFNFTNEREPLNLAIDMTANDGEASGNGTSSTVPFRFGRMRFRNANGSELTILAVPYRAEYRTTTGWVQNTEDGCTAMTTAANLQLSNDNWATSQAGNLAIAVGSGSTGVQHFSATIANGSTGLAFTAPGAGNTGNVDIRSVLTGAGNPHWLLYDWNNDGTFDEEAYGRLSFGIFSGHPRNIYLREVY